MATIGLKLALCAVSAPANDLNLLKKISSYPDKDVAKAKP